MHLGEFHSLVKHTSACTEEHGAEESLSCCERLPIIHPFGPFRLAWDMIVILELIYTSIEVPCKFRFRARTTNQFDSYYTDTLTFNVVLTLHDTAGVVALIIDLFLMTDILINFRTAFVDKYDHLHIITHPKLIARRYLSSWFLLDFVSSLPMEFLMPLFVGSGNTYTEVIKVLRIFRLLRALKMLRVLRIFRLFKGMGRHIFVREAAMFFKCFRCLV